MIFAGIEDLDDLVLFYTKVVEAVRGTKVLLGWDMDVYPNKAFLQEAIANRELCIYRKDGVIAAAAVVNHKMNPEYDEINWEIKEPKEKISTIHALAVSPDYRKQGIGDILLEEIARFCKSQGDVSIHLDVIDTNTPAYNLYMRKGYTEKDCISMYYEVVGTREFWMLERVL